MKLKYHPMLRKHKPLKLPIELQDTEQLNDKHENFIPTTKMSDSSIEDRAISKGLFCKMKYTIFNTGFAKHKA